MTKRILVTSLLFVLAFAPLGAQPDPGKEELKLKLPKPMFIGTPTNLKSSNLEVVTGKPRAAVLRPEGHRPGIDEEDRDLERHAAGHRRARHGHGWREGRRRRVLHRARARSPVGADRPRRPARAFRPFSPGTITARRGSIATCIVQVSNDAAFKTGVTTVFNNDHDNSSKIAQGKEKEYIEVAEGKLFDAKGATGRYVRLYSNGNTTNDLNHYVEVEVYGTPAK